MVIYYHRVQLRDWIESFVGRYETGCSWITQSLCFLSDLENMFCLEQHALGIKNKKAPCGNFPMREEESIVSGRCVHRILTFRSQITTQHLLGQEYVLLFPWKVLTFPSSTSD